LHDELIIAVPLRDIDAGFFYVAIPQLEPLANSLQPLPGLQPVAGFHRVETLQVRRKIPKRGLAAANCPFFGMESV
jgi:hypothetical protein